MSDNLDRFIKAQNGTFAGFTDALSELRADCKRGHWIWYVFPQMSGLGSSWKSESYAINDIHEATAYLKHPLLRKRLVEITTVVASRLRAGAPLRALMSSHIDALKVVSSLTLFSHVAEMMHATGDESDAELKLFAITANDVLAQAAAQGYPPCQHTMALLGRRPG